MKSYEPPSAEIFCWEDEDVITLSSCADPARQDCEWGVFPFEE